MKKIFSLGLLALLATGEAQGAVTLDNWGTLANVAQSVCATDECALPPSDATLAEILADANFLNFVSNLSVNPSQGGAGLSTASVSTGTWPDPGSAQSTANVASGLAIPTLTAGATADTNAWISAQSLVIQSYEYTGPGTVATPETLSLNWDLTGSINNPDNDLATGFTVFVGFFDATGLAAFPNLSDDFATVALLATLALASPADNFMEFHSDTEVAADGSGTINIGVANGDQFYLGMGLMAAAGGAGAQAASLSTLTANFDGNPDITPAITAVPLPPAVWLLGASLAALGGLGRRRSLRAA